MKFWATRFSVNLSQVQVWLALPLAAAGVVTWDRRCSKPLRCVDYKMSLGIVFPNSVSQWGLQPRIAPVCTGAGAGSGSTRFRRRFRRFRRRSGRLWCRARSGSIGFRRRFWESLVQGQVRFNGFRRRLQRRFRRRLFFFFLFSCMSTLHTCKNKTLRLLGIHPKLIVFNDENLDLRSR